MKRSPSMISRKDMLTPEIRATAERCRTCGVATREGKPFCPDHVLSAPYAAAVSTRNERLAAEIRDLEAGGEPDPNGALAAELIAALGNTPALKVLSKAFFVSPDNMLRLAEACERAGKLRLAHRTRRGGMPHAFAAGDA